MVIQRAEVLPHKGIDIGALNRGVAGDAIYAAYDGDVVIATFSSSAGNYIMINHGGGLYTRYLHASKLLVSAGTHVTKGQKIAPWEQLVILTEFIYILM